MLAPKETKMVAYPWPAPSDNRQFPTWTGRGFRLGNDVVPVLSYKGDSSGWTDELTALHEDLAGSDHPIELASREHALQELRTHVQGERPVILEVGCSSGFMLRHIIEHMPQAMIIGADYARGPLEKLAAELPEVPLIQFDLTKCPLPAGTLDAVIALNVLEHIPDDRAAAREICRILKPGGTAVIEVPAGPTLFDAYDIRLMHYRRYALNSAVRMLEEVGLKVLKGSHLGFFVYPLFWLTKQRNKRYLGEANIEQERVINRQIRNTRASRLLDLSLRMELALGKWISYPFGIRCLLTCQKSA